MAGYIEVADLIRELRDRLSLSQEKLATQLKVSLPTINRWEKGRAKPDPRAVHLIRQFIQRLGPQYEDLYQRFFSDAAQALLFEQSYPLPQTNRTKRRATPPGGEPAVKNQISLDTKSMEGLLWKAACSIRGEKDAPKFKDYILPLVFIKRLSDVFEDEVERLTQTYGDRETALEVLEADHELVRFYLPPEARWPVVSGREKFNWPAA